MAIIYCYCCCGCCCNYHNDCIVCTYCCVVTVQAKCFCTTFSTKCLLCAHLSLLKLQMVSGGCFSRRNLCLRSF